MKEKKSLNYLKRLISGQIPLYISFWIWFVLISLIIEILFKTDFVIINFENNENIFFDLKAYIATFLYSSFIFIVVFKSANRYLGNKIWSFLAKVLVTLNLFLSITVLIDTIKIYFLQDYSIEKNIQEFKSNLPINVDSNTQLVDITKEDKTIFYVYKLEKNSFQENFKVGKFKRQVQDSLCEDENMLSLLKKDYILDYKYLNEENKELMNIITNKNSCGKNIYDLDILKAILEQQS